MFQSNVLALNGSLYSIDLKLFGQLKHKKIDEKREQKYCDYILLLNRLQMGTYLVAIQFGLRSNDRGRKTGKL